MIAFIKGTVDSLSEGKMILESHGIGYELNIPASMFDAGVREGEELKIYTHMSVREDGISLFGFLSREDLEIYRMLIGVSGIGPKAALAVLSGLDGTGILEHVASINVEKDYDIIVQYDDRYTIRLGGTDDLAYKIQYLTSILAELSDFQAGTIDLTDAANKKATFQPAG